MEILKYIIGGLVLALGVFLGINKFRNSKISNIIEKAEELIDKAKEKTQDLEVEIAKIDQKADDLTEEKEKVDSMVINADDIKRYFDEMDHKK